MLIGFFRDRDEFGPHRRTMFSTHNSRSADADIIKLPRNPCQILIRTSKDCRKQQQIVLIALHTRRDVLIKCHWKKQDPPHSGQACTMLINPHRQIIFNDASMQ